MSLEKTNTDRNDNCAPAKLVNVSTNLEDVVVGRQVGRPDVDVHVPEITHHHYFIFSLF